MSGVVLSSSIRSNLMTLQSTSAMQGEVQNRLATGKKVNSALDNPTNFFTAAALSRRGNDLSALLDGMSSGIKTLEAADNAMKSITKTVEAMQANIRQARQDKSFKAPPIRWRRPRPATCPSRPGRSARPRSASPSRRPRA
jgi:flagellin-like hook-associated protein FlgL